MPVQEVRAHLSGPSSRNDDQGYREMARAYDTFKPVDRVYIRAENWNHAKLLPNPSSTLRETNPSSDALTEQDGRNITPEAAEPGTGGTGVSEYIHETPIAVASLESQLLTSSLVMSQEVAASGPGSDHQKATSRNLTLEKHPKAFSQQDHGKGGNDSSLKFQGCIGTIHSEKSSQSSSESLSTIIVPPLPPSGESTCPATFVTPKLQWLADLLEISERFRPATTTRELAPSERGYWRIDVSSWSPQLQNEFWSYLSEFVGSGAAGWGVSCYWMSAKEAEPDVTRMYCWGEIVGHVYLLAFVASKSRVKQTKPTWVDADGMTVLQMP